MESSFVNKGELVESFIGQELLAYSNPFTHSELYYWHREQRGSHAEVDYLWQQDGAILPIEVKSSKHSKLKSLWAFLDTHPQSPYGIKVDIHNHGDSNKIRRLPLYSMAQLAHKQSPLMSLFD